MPQHIKSGSTHLDNMQIRPRGFFDTLRGAGEFLVWAGVGVGLLVLAPRLKTKNAITTANVIGFGSIGVGAVRFGLKVSREGRAVSPPCADDPVNNPTAPAVIRDPDEGEVWSRFSFHTADVEVFNESSELRTGVVGITMIAPTGQVFDFVPKIWTLDPGRSKTFNWIMFGTPGGEWIPGNWQIIASTWDIIPTGDCENQGTCCRLGQDMHNFVFALTG